MRVNTHKHTHIHTHAQIRTHKHKNLTDGKLKKPSAPSISSNKQAAVSKRVTDVDLVVVDVADTEASVKPLPPFIEPAETVRGQSFLHKTYAAACPIFICK